MDFYEIHNYIQTYANGAIISRGKEIYNSKLVAFLLYENNIAKYAVKGTGGKYLVTIIFDNEKLITQCTCPYSFSGICKHKVACLIDVADKLQKKQIVLKSIKKRSATEPFIIKDFLPFNFVIKNYDTFYIDLKLKSLVNNKMEIEVKKDYEAGKYIVTMECFDKELYVTCTCAEKVAELCTHQRNVLGQLLSRNGTNLFQILTPSFQNNLKKELYTIYDLDSTIDLNDVIFFTLHNSKLDYQLKPKFAGLLSVKQLQNPEEYFDLKENEISEKDAEKSKYQVGFVFQPMEYGLIPQGFYGTLNKSREKFSARLTEINDLYQTVEFNLDDNEYNALKILEKLNFELTKYHLKDDLNYPAIHQLYNDLFDLLQNNKFVFFNDTAYLRKENLTNINLSPDRLTLNLLLKETEDFYLLKPEYLLDNNQLKDNFELLSSFVLKQNNTLYLVADYNYAKVLSLFKKHDELKVTKNNFNLLFDNIMKPLSQNINVKIKSKSIKQKNQTLTYSGNRLYISEMGNYVLFKPYILYEDNVEILAFSENDVLRKEGDIVIINKIDKEQHQAFISFLKSLHPKFEKSFRQDLFHLTADEFVHNNWFINAFEQLSENKVVVFGLNDLKNLKYSPYKAKVNVQLSSGEDWFDAKIEVLFGEHKVSLKDIQKAIEKRERFVVLGDGTRGLLPDDWLRRFESYLRQGEIKKGLLKISKFKFSLIDELFDNIDSTEILQELNAKRQKLLEFKEIKKFNQPLEITADLRDYQKEGVNWLHFLHEFNWGGILADDMGLGKTLQILTFLTTVQNSKSNPSLIVVPTTLIFNWRREIEKFAPTLEVLYYYGLNRNEDLNNFKKYDLIITTYGLVVNDIEKLQHEKFNYIIIDESQAIKNSNSKRYKAVCLLNAKNRIALTGTPIENNTFDLYSQMTFLNPGLLGTQTSFKENYSTPIDRDRDIQRAKELQRLINPFILRRTKEQVATELPPKIEDVLFCNMDEEQYKVYEAFREKYRNYLINKFQEEGFEKSKLFVLEGLLKLRQICDSPALLSDDEDYGSDSVKIRELIRHIEEKTAHHKILVFSQFVKMLKLIEKELNTKNILYEYLDGQCSQKDREASVENFQTNENCRVFLISLKAGGFGLNLTQADYVYIVDPWWNPAVENQAIDRCYRIGQDKHVIAYRMICKDTVEEKIVALQNRKKQIASDIIQTDENVMKQLDQNDILDLFR